MKLYFAGAESPSHLKVLKGAGVERIAINVTSLYARLPKSRRVVWSLQDRFPAPLEVCLYPNPSDDDWDRYRGFLEANPGAAMTVGPAGVEWDDIEGYVPLWDGNLKMVDGLCARNPYVAASENVLKTPASLRRLQSAAMAHGTQLVALGAARSLLQGRWTAAVVSSWQSAQRYGETQVWDGRELHRYATGQAEEARRRHRADIERLGVDPDAVEADDKGAVLLLAIRSWQAFEQAKNPAVVDGAVVAIGPERRGDDSGLPVGAALATGGPRGGNERVRTTLPGMVLRTVIEHSEDEFDEDGNPVELSRSTTFAVGAESLRQCNNCFVAHNCPAYTPDSVCAYAIPVEIRTKDQYLSLLDAIIEQQTQRVLFARFTEEMEGQGLDPAVGAEEDRLFKLISMRKEILDNRDTFRLEMEAKGETGMISRVFGERMGMSARTLKEPVKSDHVLDVFDRS
jgi:hypothetical protein